MQSGTALIVLIISHASDNRCVCKVTSSICDFVCLSVCVLLCVCVYVLLCVCVCVCVAVGVESASQVHRAENSAGVLGT